MKPLVWRQVEDWLCLALVLAMAGALAWRCLRKSAEPVALIVKWIITAVLVFGTVWLLPHYPYGWWPIIVLIPAASVGLLWAPSVGDFMSRSLTNAIDGGFEELEPQPFYSIAETQRRNSHPQEAVRLVREQLEKFPGDFRGAMLLAAIQAEDLNDLPGAQITLEKWMEGPEATPQGMAAALTALADWQLQFAQDPEAARVALERIVQALPDTPIAHRAAQRLAHLPTVEYLTASRAGVPLDLRPGEKDIGLRRGFTVSAPSADPGALADDYVKQLEKHPADTDTREKLAVLYAEHFQRLDLAVDQLEQLIGFPNETPKHIAHWLNLLADLQIRFGKDRAAAEAALRRIIEQFPYPSLAEPAQARLAALNAEIKSGSKTQVKTLGRYEKNLGLRQAGQPKG